MILSTCWLDMICVVHIRRYGAQIESVSTLLCPGSDDIIKMMCWLPTSAALGDIVCFVFIILMEK